MGQVKYLIEMDLILSFNNPFVDLYDDEFSITGNDISSDQTVAETIKNQESATIHINSRCPT